MKMHILKLLVLLFMMAAFAACTFGERNVFGTWELQPDESTDLATWRYRTLTLDISQQGKQTVLIQKWRRGNEPFFTDSLAFVPDGDAIRIPITRQHWPDNWYMGVLAVPGSERTVTGEWQSEGQAFTVSSTQPVQTSQGEFNLKTTLDVSMDKKLDVLRISVQRETRPTPIELVFKRVSR
ncbi:MAG: hypothetical protein H6695_10125 [Deferribacteres bacterium]|nr:hypothetical protein [Deferribacteres bacterium]